MTDNLGIEAEAEDHPSVDQLTPEEASRIIHSHRKVRYGERRQPRGRWKPLTQC